MGVWTSLSTFKTRETAQPTKSCSYTSDHQTQRRPASTLQYAHWSTSPGSRSVAAKPRTFGCTSRRDYCSTGQILRRRGAHRVASALYMSGLRRASSGCRSAFCLERPPSESSRWLHAGSNYLSGKCSAREYAARMAEQPCAYEMIAVAVG